MDLLSIAVTLIFCAISSILILTSFSICNMNSCFVIAPRARNRSKEAMNINNATNYYDYCLGWIPYVLRISYRELIAGVEGLSLDSVIFLKFHVYCFKLCLFIMILSLGIALPLNLTSDCTGGNTNSTSTISSGCEGLTDYDRTTSANLPTVTSDQFSLNLGSIRGFFLVVILWVIVIVTCVSLKNEWIKNIELRRIFYLERNHYKSSNERADIIKALGDERGEGDETFEEECRAKAVELPAFLNPEAMNTVPSVDLYSVLISNIPQKPADLLFSPSPDTSTTSGHPDSSFCVSALEWQQAVTAEVFHKAVPVAIGSPFTSSVIAVTILPYPSALSKAWRAFYRTLSYKRRLTYVRKLITTLSASSSDEPPPTDLSEHESANLMYDGAIQANMYRLEYARSGGMCCPLGCCQERLTRMSIDELRDVEAELVDGLRKAEDELGVLQGKAVSKTETRAKAHAAALQSDEERASAEGRDWLSAEGNLDMIPASPSAFSSPLPSDTYQNPSLIKLTRRRMIGANSSSSNSTRRFGRANPYSFDESENLNLNDDDVKVILSKVGFKYERGVSTSISNYKSCLPDGTETEFDDDDFFIPQTSEYPISPNTVHTNIIRSSFNSVSSFCKNCCKKTPQMLRSFDLLEGGTNAIVTFSSRSDALTARNSRIDGRGFTKWLSEGAIPVPPLADAAQFDLKTCRNCCRPVTLTISQGQKRVRRYITFACLFLIYLGYTIPIAFIADLTKSLDDGSDSVISRLSGLIPGLLQTITLAILPTVFKLLSNFGSNASSLPSADRSALNYYWYFQVTVGFTGSFLAGILVSFFSFGSTGVIFEGTFREGVNEIAANLPTTSSAVWLNWILLRTFFSLPLTHLTQFVPAVYTLLHLNCCARCMQGGGYGGPIPLRDYVDSSVVLLCCISFSVISPLVTPCCVAYFAVCIPLYRRQLILVHRPVYDLGGLNFKFFSTCVFGSLYVGVIIVAITLLFKNMFTPSLLTILTILPLIDFQINLGKLFVRSFEDIALLQSGLLRDDDLFTACSSSSLEEGLAKSGSEGGSSAKNDYEESETPEKFRQWLVDGHIAAYVPVCLAGNKETVELLTSTPSETIPGFDCVGSVGVGGEGEGSVGGAGKSAKSRESGMKG